MQRVSFFTILTVVACICVCLPAATAQPPSTPTIPTAFPIPFSPSSVATLRTQQVGSVGDTKQGSVALYETAPTLQELLAHWSAETGVTLTVETPLADRRIVWLSRPVPLASAMETVACAESLEWTRQTKPDGSVFYRLFEPEAVTKKRDDAQKVFLHEWEENKKRMAAALRHGLDKAVTEQKDTPSFGSVLDALTTTTQRDKMAQLAQEPVGPISAGSQSHYHNHVMFARPYAQLPETVKTTLGQLFNRPEYQGKSEIPYAPPVSDLSLLPQTQVGFVAAFGTVRLGIVSPNGKDVWVSPFEAVNPDQKVLYDAAVADHVAGRAPQVSTVDLKGISDLPATVRGRHIRIKRNPSFTDSAEIVQEIVLQCPELNVVSDACLASRPVSFRQLRVGGQFTVEECLMLLCQNTQHSARLINGTLQLTTERLGRDIVTEPPVSLVNSFREAGAVTFENITAEARLHPAAHEVFTACHPLLLKKVFPIAVYQSAHPFLAYYAQLDTAAQKRAASPTGLPYSEMTKEQKAGFEAICDVGLPQMVSVLQKGTAGFKTVITHSDTGISTMAVLSVMSPYGNFVRYDVKFPQRAISLTPSALPLRSTN